MYCEKYVDNAAESLIVVFCSADTFRVGLGENSEQGKRLEWYKIATQSTDAIFYSDQNNDWYQGDLLHIYQELVSIVHKYKSVTCLGASMGGYISLLMSSILNINDCIVFSPNTNLTHTWMWNFNKITNHWPDSLVFSGHDRFKSKFFDCKPYMKISLCKFHIHVAKKNLWDIYNLDHIRELENVKIKYYDSDSHTFFVQLKQKGLLPNNITDLLI